MTIKSFTTSAQSRPGSNVNEGMISDSLQRPRFVVISPDVDVGHTYNYSIYNIYATFHQFIIIF